MNNDTKLFNFVPKFLKEKQSIGINTIIISGAPVEILNAYKSMLKFYDIYGLEVGLEQASIYTAVVNTNFGTAKAKAQAVKLASVTSEIRIALGNSISDAPLFEASPCNIFIVENVSEIAGLRQHPSLFALDINYVTPDKFYDTSFP